ncbi:MAG: hypothetical protein K9N46_00120 [Candidatus Marinimicrobia bacterium]|nr:hypothetical protein [Candidatus Neomarinimicrobiota bacterium]MCF7829913.1 hypothetical protein [Candidatus Neomarinimicrobiota bacterium]MCF7879124.1 hypothetical protein [Candidatus Neomarinimicrobiota bacterium]
MRFLTHKSIAAMVVITLVALVSCQNTPMQPQSETAAGIQYVKANPEVLGLAKGELSVTEVVTKNNGAVLGGEDMHGNYVSIPGGALDENMTMTFSIDVTEDGVLTFSVEGAGVAEDEHIYFNDGQTATMAVNKDWLSDEPDIAVLIGADEQYTVSETAESYLVELPHFSRYAWGILE